MTPGQMDEILNIIGPDITRQHTNFRQPIEARQRLAVTLRYLATGETFSSLAFSYRLGERTVSQAVLQTCDAIVCHLKTSQLPKPTADTWRATARRFQEKFDFPHCLGALDGKHVNVFAPANSGSQFFNYKRAFSIVLMALVDADLKILAVQIGDYGRCSDGGVFANSALGRGLQNKTLDLPAPEFIPGAEDLGELPYVFVADAAFPLKTNLMRPYPGHNLSHAKKTFNYRLSRARNTVEDAFGILSSRWRVLLSRIMLEPHKVDKVVMATCILHNYLTQPSHQTGTETDRHITELNSVPAMGGNRGSNAAYEVQDTFARYFNSPVGSIARITE
ncbi:hypothetical protein ACEWY4_007097 [Coilia grayii]|uniref:DDE Tnp4 domain-containing protein n=1 Tax=Coilia grayii TaxID=363190 RepID=A0ABD1KFH8_9TELE